MLVLSVSLTLDAYSTSNDDLNASGSNVTIDAVLAVMFAIPPMTSQMLEVDATAADVASKTITPSSVIRIRCMRDVASALSTANADMTPEPDRERIVFNTPETIAPDKTAFNAGVNPVAMACAVALVITFIELVPLIRPVGRGELDAAVDL